MEAEALYVRDGDGFVGTILTQGGWDPQGANGGTVLALLGQCLEEVPSLVPMGVSRITADLVRPVPLGRRLHVTHSILREGKKIQVVLLQLLVQADSIPCIATIARDAAGGKLNVNADTAAGAVAAVTKADKLVVVSDTHGIRKDVNDPDSRISHLTVTQIDEMVKNGSITSGMLPKVEACVTALRGGVSKAHIIDGRIPHSLLLEIYTEAGIGTEIVL